MLEAIALASVLHVSDPDWNALAQCESGGNWSINTGNGFHGGIQFSPDTWRAYGGSGSAENASREEQIRIGAKVLAAQGPGAWPACSASTGWYKKSGSNNQEKHSNNNNNQKKHSSSSSNQEKHSSSEHSSTIVIKGSLRTVRAGDTLSLMFGNDWQRVYEKNKSVIGGNPDHICPGQRLML